MNDKILEAWKEMGERKKKRERERERERAREDKMSLE